MSISKPSKTVSRSGRFTKGPAAEVMAFSESVSYDWRLWRHDIIGSMAHARMLNSIGVLNAKELDEITAVITENISLLETEIDTEDKKIKFLGEIKKAANRADELTSRLSKKKKKAT